jgi:hypothetical protein
MGGDFNRRPPGTDNGQSQDSNAEADANQHPRPKAVSKSTRPAPVSPDAMFFSLYASQRSVYAQSTHSLHAALYIEIARESTQPALPEVLSFFSIKKKAETATNGKLQEAV